MRRRRTQNAMKRISEGFDAADLKQAEMLLDELGD